MLRRTSLRWRLSAASPTRRTRPPLSSSPVHRRVRSPRTRTALTQLGRESVGAINSVETHATVVSVSGDVAVVEDCLIDRTQFVRPGHGRSWWRAGRDGCFTHLAHGADRAAAWKVAQRTRKDERMRARLKVAGAVLVAAASSSLFGPSFAGPAAARSTVPLCGQPCRRHPKVCWRGPGRRWRSSTPTSGSPTPCDDEHEEVPEDGNDTIEHIGFLQWRLSAVDQGTWDDIYGSEFGTIFRLECYCPRVDGEFGSLIDLREFDAINPQIIAQVAIDDALGAVPTQEIQSNPGGREPRRHRHVVLGRGRARRWRVGNGERARDERHRHRRAGWRQLLLWRWHVHVLPRVRYTVVSWSSVGLHARVQAGPASTR